MIENHEKLPNGIIHQLNSDKFIYDLNYIKKYIDLDGIVRDMSYLRLGYLEGVIGHSPNSILDIGYGDGTFLSVCSKKIKDCYGNDVTGYSVPDGCKFIDHDEILKTKVEVVTFFDSLEHFQDITFIKDLQTRYIMISVPECHYFSDEWFKNWKHRRPDEHLWYFNKDSLFCFMKEMGYRLLQFSNIEDIIRKADSSYSNILTGVFEKISD